MGDSMEVGVSNGKMFKKLIKVASKFSDEATIKLTDEGMRLQAMDPAKISLIDAFIPSDAFETFNINGEEVVGIKLNEIISAMKRVKDSEKITLATKDTYFTVKIEGKARRTFRFSLLDKNNAYPTPNINFTASVKVIGDALQTALREADTVAEYVRIEINSSGLYITGKGSISEYYFEATDTSLLEKNVSEPATAVFNLEYLLDFVSEATSTTAIIVSLKNDSPVRLAYNVGECVMTMYLAPRMET